MRALPTCVLLLSSFIVHSFGNIILKDYCENKTNPIIIPNKGRESSGFLEWSGTIFPYDSNIHCNVTLAAEGNFHLLLSFTSINLRNSSMDMLNVTYENGLKTMELSGQMKCGNESCKRFMFQSGFDGLTLEFSTSNVTVPSGFNGFKALYTVFDSYSRKTGKCKESDNFVCKNGHCIVAELVCDGHNNCGDNSDESFCTVSPHSTVWGIAVIAIAVIVTVIFIPAFCFLAAYGTKSIVKSTTLPNMATPLYSALNVESTNLLSSSGIQSSYFGSLDYGPSRPRSHTVDVAIPHSDGPSTSSAAQFSQSYHSAAVGLDTSS